MNIFPINLGPRRGLRSSPPVIAPPPLWGSNRPMLESLINPENLRLEASSACQLRCPSCPTTTGAARPTVGRGWRRAPDFQALLDANPQVRRIELSNYGEIFVNPQLEEILRIANERG